MALDPQARAVLDQMAEAGGPPINELSVSEARQGSAALAAMQGLPEPVGSVEDRKLPGPDGGIPVRIYVPFGKGPFPVLLYFHGGGWVIGDIESSDGLCRILTNAAGCIVVSVDYRLAPEHPFPAAADDAYQATLWVATNASSFGGDPSRIAVCGDSAGGNLAAVVAQMRARSRETGDMVSAAHLPGHRRRVRHPILQRKCRRLFPDEGRHAVVLESLCSE